MSWTFRGVSFERAIGDSDSQWFARKVATNIETIGASSRRVIDIGGTITEPLSFVAHCSSASAATTLASYLGTQGTLTSVNGDSSTALLVQADKLAHDGIFFRVLVTFEAVS